MDYNGLLLLLLSHLVSLTLKVGLLKLGLPTY